MCNLYIFLFCSVVIWVFIHTHTHTHAHHAGCCGAVPSSLSAVVSILDAPSSSLSSDALTSFSLAMPPPTSSDTCLLYHSAASRSGSGYLAELKLFVP